MNRLVTDNRMLPEVTRQPDRRRVEAFHYYELVPNSDVQDYADQRARYRLRTNSHGMADREYTREKPPGTRRLALFGDSVTRGQGAPFQGNYEALLEARLNEERLGGQRYEILNFAVGSYSLMQMMDVALERAVEFDPDVYVVALTDRNVYRRWGDHLVMLTQAGIDLKYDYLRGVAREAGLAPTDSRGVVAAKLARHRIPTITWALSQIQAHADARGAEVLVLFVPTADDPALLREEFLGVPAAIAELGLPVVDLLDAFGDLEDRGPIRVAPNDRHPNAEGHRRLAEQLYGALTRQPEVRAVVVGTTGPGASS